VDKSETLESWSNRISTTR